MKTYRKTHSNPKAAKSHEEKIKARGGKVTKTKKGKQITLEYCFPAKKGKSC